MKSCIKFWGAYLLILALWLPAMGKSHPFLLFQESDIPLLRQKASSAPWSEWKDAVENSHTLSYSGFTFKEKANSLSTIMEKCSLAYILFPEKKDQYKTNIVNQFPNYLDILAIRQSEPYTWSHMVRGGDAAFFGVLALDIIYNDLTVGERDTMENALTQWFDYEANNFVGTWYLAKWGSLGIWAAYREDSTDLDSYAGSYLNRWYDHLTPDGVATLGTTYANARLAGNEIAKTYFLDVLTYIGWHDFYSDPVIRSFYEWYYEGSVTPMYTRHIFHDGRDRKHDELNFVALARANRFSEKAASHGAWMFTDPNPTMGGTVYLLRYIFESQTSATPVAPRSNFKFSGYASMWETSPDENSLMGALSCVNKDVVGHTHYDVNALHLVGFRKHLLRNGGYNGWGKGAGSFSWDFLQNFDCTSANDYAVSGNIVYLNRDVPHVSKIGGGLQEYITSASLDYACGSSGDALNLATHWRNLVFVKSQEGENHGYFILFDEVSKESGNSETLVRMALHPESANVTTTTTDTEYIWDMGDGVFATIFLGTPTASGTRLKYGGMGDVSGDVRYIHAEYDIPYTHKRFVSLVFPHDSTYQKPDFLRVGESTYSGAVIAHQQGPVDHAFESDTVAENIRDDVTFRSKASFYRLINGRVSQYLVRQGKIFFDSDGATKFGFQSPSNISLFLKGNRGALISSGTHVTFYAPGIQGVLLDGVSLTPESFGDGFVEVNIPSGGYALELVTSTLPIWYSGADFGSVHGLGGQNINPLVVDFDVTPSVEGSDNVIGYADSSTTISTWNSMSMLIRMYTNGLFDVRNGDQYQSVNSVPWSAGKTYHIQMVTDLKAGTYSVMVTPPGGVPIVLAENYLFRTDAPPMDDLGKICLKSTADNDFRIENHQVQIQPFADDFYATFEGLGVWKRDSGSDEWSRLTTDAASQIVCGDFDGDGAGDLAGVWPIGIWIRYHQGNWEKILSSDNLIHLSCGDMNGDGLDDLVGSWTVGVYQRDSASGQWIRILEEPATQVSCGDFDGDGADDLVGSWDAGIWIHYSQGEWDKVLNSTDLIQIASGDMNGDGQDDLVGSWNHGCWFFNLATGEWSKLHDSAELITTGDIDGNGKDDLVGSWDGTPGIWTRLDSGAWSQIISQKALDIGTGKTPKLP